MEDPSPPKCIVAAERGNGWDSVCDGIRVDEEWKHQPVSEAWGCRSAEARTSFCSRCSSSLVTDVHTIVVGRRRC